MTTSKVSASEVRLREVVDADLAVFHAQENDPEANERAKFPARERERFMKHWRERILADEQGLVRTVLVEGRVAGNILCWDEAGKRMIGYWLGREFWGRGVATKALTDFLGLAPWRPLYADPAVGNTGSVRLLEKCGFERVGTERLRSLSGPGEDEHAVFRLD